MEKYIYAFNEGSKEMKSLLGGKGANLAEMTKIGLPVPGGFTITTKACIDFYEKNQKIWDELLSEINEHIAKLEEEQGKKFDSQQNPLLVSVRSGAVISMPGMMDTILNLGLNDETVKVLSKKTSNERFAYDSYRRFIQMFSDVAMGIEKYKFESVLERVKEENDFEYDTELETKHLKAIVEEFKNIYKIEMKKDFPQNPKEQLLLAVEAVFRSWNNPRAIIYRKINDIPNNLGTAVNIQSMVFGNMGDDSGTGVAFTRNPATGEHKVFGEFLMNAQGEDVVAGIRTPKDISKLEEVNKAVYDEFMDVTKTLENHYKDMQDIEFTVEQGKLFLLQTRNGKRTAKASIEIAVDMVDNNIISKEEAILRINPNDISQLLHPNFEVKALDEANVLAKGLPASPGAASGRVYFNANDVVNAKARGEKAILVRTETSPEDIEGMVNCEGILTSRGGMTSHAAVVARGMGKCCVAGCGEIKVDEEKRYFRVSGKTFEEGQYISLNGSTGNVYEGNIPRVEADLSGSFETFMSWVDNYRSLKVRTNADTPLDSKTAVRFGAEGIGLCRTEHMFFDEDRIEVVRQMIVSKTVEERKLALDKLLPIQREDFRKIFEIMEQRPVTIRLLDPPLHEFLPKKKEDIKALASQMNISYDELYIRIEELQEFNPMLGHRGCRLAITYPEIYAMQAKAIIEGALEAKKEGVNVNPEIMIPLVGHVKELKLIKDMIKELCDKLILDSSIDLKYKIGTMIEVPRAALTADEIATQAEFFSFGTNDLTQMTFGFSRDDANKFLREYEEKDVLEKDPFQALDQTGVGKLVKMACDLGRQTRKDIKLGICGEHGGEPSSIEFFHNIGLEYVSCSPYRVPVARVAAAQAKLKEKNSQKNLILQ
ncbi:MAG: pyruvate, phosphate dikinase [Peptostreptococcaceae bacterium]|jgi:pyruvate,orthophosphate dikinase|nr:pyruvate, phosphate dikinase [Peptostreptococcaceae bacterium]